MAKQGIDLKAEMAKKLKEVEEHFLKEKVPCTIVVLT